MNPTIWDKKILEVGQSFWDGGFGYEFHGLKYFGL